MINIRVLVLVVSCLGAATAAPPQGRMEDKAKRAEEEIMFGNQQNKPSTVMDNGVVASGYFPSVEQRDDGTAHGVTSPDHPVGGKKFFDLHKSLIFDPESETSLYKQPAYYGYPAAYGGYDTLFGSSFYRRRRRGSRKRALSTQRQKRFSLRTSLPDLLNTRASRRYKRHVDIEDGEYILGLLALLAAEEQAQKENYVSPPELDYDYPEIALDDLIPEYADYTDEDYLDPYGHYPSTRRAVTLNKRLTPSFGYGVLSPAEGNFRKRSDSEDLYSLAQLLSSNKARDDGLPTHRREIL